MEIEKLDMQIKKNEQLKEVGIKEIEKRQS